MPYENGMLTPEEIEPTAEDLEFAAKLIQDGYESISNRYRTVVRFIEKPFSKVTLRDLIKPELQHIPEVKWLMSEMAHRKPSVRSFDHIFKKEELQLTVKQFRAFKLQQGKVAW